MPCSPATSGWPCRSRHSRPHSPEDGATRRRGPVRARARRRAGSGGSRTADSMSSTYGRPVKPLRSWCGSIARPGNEPRAGPGAQKQPAPGQAHSAPDEPGDSQRWDDRALPPESTPDGLAVSPPAGRAGPCAAGRHAASRRGPWLRARSQPGSSAHGLCEAPRTDRRASQHSETPGFFCEKESQFLLADQRPRRSFSRSNSVCHSPWWSPARRAQPASRNCAFQVWIRLSLTPCYQAASATLS